MPTTSPIRLLWLMAGCGLLLGCAVGRSSNALPADNTVVRGQLVIHSDFPLPGQHRLLDELVAQRDAMAAKLNLRRSDEPIHVFLFDAPESYGAYIRQHHPEFPDRRAFFVKDDARLAVYAHWSDRVAEDLRHEVAHGYLHAVIAHVPLWLDEGIAEYFEVPGGHNGFHPPHLQLLLERLEAGQWWPDMQRLERLDSADEMTLADYAESWAWVHLLLETTPERRQLLQDQLAQLAGPSQPQPLSDRLGQSEPSPQPALIAHLKELNATHLPHSKRPR